MNAQCGSVVFMASITIKRNVIGLNFDAEICTSFNFKDFHRQRQQVFLITGFNFHVTLHSKHNHFMTYIWTNNITLSMRKWASYCVTNLWPKLMNSGFYECNVHSMCMARQSNFAVSDDQISNQLQVVKKPAIGRNNKMWLFSIEK